MLLILLVLLAAFFIYKWKFAPSPKVIEKKKVINVFGKPNVTASNMFPENKPLFTTDIASIKSSTLLQQSVKIYTLTDKKNPVFERPYYADGFRGKSLTYIFSKDSPSFIQEGLLGTLGCVADVCALSWNNFYTWDAKQHSFVLDNTAHVDDFKKLQETYQSRNEKGCSVVEGTIEDDQMNLSFEELYKKFPNASWYCSKEQGILPSRVIFFLKAQKAIEEIVNGDNIGSNDINSIAL